MSYSPYLLKSASIEQITSPEYRRSLERDVLAAGVRLLLDRRERHPGYPLPDTKFNPNTGEDYPERQYETTFTWFLGRGGESCSQHLRILDSLDDLADVRSEADSMLRSYVANIRATILEVLEVNDGRVPFRIDRRSRAIDEEGAPVSLSHHGCNASELFCAKALMASGSDEDAARGEELFRRFVEASLANGYEDDTATYDRSLHAEGPFMLSFAAFPYLLERDRDARSSFIDLAGRLFDYVLDRFYDPSSRHFFELIDFASGERQPKFLPGHACELVGLGLQAITAIEESELESPGLVTAQARQSIDRAKETLPEILFTAYSMGYNHTYGGMYESVDPTSGRTLNSDMPWWCLPEAMRAATHALTVVDDQSKRDRCLEILTTSSDDYFTHYPNERMHLFPFRTRSGETGRVKDRMPVVPEADPLYHTNLAVIDLLEVLARLRT